MTSSKSKGKKANAIEIPVEFGNVNIGDETVKISLKIDREKIDLDQADNVFCGRRLTGSVQKGGYDDGDRQSKLFQTDINVQGTFDIHRFGVTPKAFTTGLTFKKGEIEVGEISGLAKGKGRLLIDDCIDIPHNVAEPEDDKPETNQTLPGTFKSDLPWKKVSLDTLFKGGLLKSLKEAGLDTVGALYEYQQPDKNGNVKQLRDIPGLGPQKVTQVEDRMLEFWRDNPTE